MSIAVQEITESARRLCVTVRGAVQGVGFRPFVYRLAHEIGLNGWVNNTPQGVFIEVEGTRERLDSFLTRLSTEKPPRSFIQSIESTYLEPTGYTDFRIRDSEDTGVKTAIVLPDIAVCSDCLSDISNPQNRRYRYPFTNCTNCGPRFSIIEALPYDRPHTTMKAFEMCAACRAEYDDPLDRRFHAQPNACPECGPHVELWGSAGKLLLSGDEALTAATEAIREGRIVAIKGIGGFHLMADARNDEAVSELRRRKHREEKPLAIMAASVDQVEQLCELSDLELRSLTSPEAPIVLLKSRPHGSHISELVAPHNPYLGVMLPYTPLHHLLMEELGFPVIATSGNLSDEPICIDEHEAVKRLAGIADLFLVHDRPIVRHVDDSIVREVMGSETVVRRGRGMAPLPFKLNAAAPPTIAAGAHLKNTVAVASGDQVFVSQHIGDLETREAYHAFERVVHDLEDLYEIKPAAAAFDEHPDYVSTKWARGSGMRAVPVQHHYAHVLSCMAENELAPPVLGIAWDGTGYGTDGTVWGGEFLKVTNNGFERRAHLRTFQLPGGDQAAREPRRSALGLLYEMFDEKVFEKRNLFPVLSFMPTELKVISEMFRKGLNAPVTSSAGRLFDAVASIMGLRERIRFEGQAAMELEFLADERETGAYSFELNRSDDGPAVLDWEPMVRGIFSDTDDGIPAAVIAARFHNTLVEMMATVAEDAGLENVALSGGCFQNKFLIERAVARLQKAGFNVHWHRRIPTNDGGIALGQIAAAARASTEEEWPAVLERRT